MTKVAVLQSNYIPWKGYFDIINDVDTFIFYDDVQYTKNDWRNRNLIKTQNGNQWLTIPIGSHNDKLICEVEFQNLKWAEKHYKSIKTVYSKTPYYRLYKDFIEDVYIFNKWEKLSELNQYLIKYISQEFLGINTRFKDSREYSLYGNKSERLISLLKLSGADQYLSGPSAKEYIKNELFDDHKIDLVYKDYSGYPEYCQLYPPFCHQVSILDLLFNTGPDAPYYIWGWRT